MEKIEQCRFRELYWRNMCVSEVSVGFLQTGKTFVLLSKLAHSRLRRADIFGIPK